MMQYIQLDPIPSQEFNVTTGGNNYSFRIFSSDGNMLYDISIDNASGISGFPMVNDVPLLVYSSQEINGNFLLTLPDTETPDYSRFGSSQFLYYLEQDEINFYRLATEL